MQAQAGLARVSGLKCPVLLQAALRGVQAIGRPFPRGLRVTSCSLLVLGHVPSSQRSARERISLV